MVLVFCWGNQQGWWHVAPLLVFSRCGFKPWNSVPNLYCIATLINTKFVMERMVKQICKTKSKLSIYKTLVQLRRKILWFAKAQVSPFLLFQVKWKYISVYNKINLTFRVRRFLVFCFSVCINPEFLRRQQEESTIMQSTIISMNYSSSDSALQIFLQENMLNLDWY